MRALAHGWLDPADVYVNDPIVATLRLREGQPRRGSCKGATNKSPRVGRGCRCGGVHPRCC
jgi:hypothetical protein